jgi:predicted nucleic acid-binding protein
MSIYVETDFLLALARDSDWLQGRAEDALAEYDIETSAFSYLELLLARERYEFEYVPLVTNLLELVPVRMTPLDAFHAATAETRQLDVLSFEQDYEDIDVTRIPLESDEGE